MQIDLLWKVILLKRTAVHLHQRLAEVHEGGSDVDVMDIDVANDPLLIDDEDSPFANPFFPQHTIFVCHSAVGIKIRKHREPNKIALGGHLFGPGKKGGKVIHCNPEQDGLIILKYIIGNSWRCGTSTPYTATTVFSDIFGEGVVSNFYGDMIRYFDGATPRRGVAVERIIDDRGTIAIISEMNSYLPDPTA